MILKLYNIQLKHYIYIIQYDIKAIYITHNPNDLLLIILGQKHINNSNRTYKAFTLYTIYIIQYVYRQNSTQCIHDLDTEQERTSIAKYEGVGGGVKRNDAHCWNDVICLMVFISGGVLWV